ncbi:MAG: hypothetical protein LBC97_00465 [Bifidobacteriaceae bacterium]|jgi:hypothetical protein|nr:hypothetical protein [Bifidobacteriaceae bacterium]
MYEDSPLLPIGGGALLAGTGAVTVEVWWLSVVAVAAGLGAVALSRLIRRPKINREP